MHDDDEVELIADVLVNGVKHLVAGSIGPYGAHLHDGSEYTGSYIDRVSVEVSLYFNIALCFKMLFSGFYILFFLLFMASVEGKDSTKQVQKCLSVEYNQEVARRSRLRWFWYVDTTSMFGCMRF